MDTAITIDFANEILKGVQALLPETVLLITFVLAILADLIFKKSKYSAAIVALTGCLVVGIVMLAYPATSQSAFSGLVAVDSFAEFFKYIILLSTIIVIVMSFSSKELDDSPVTKGEYYTLMLGMAFGMFLLVGASNLIMMYLAIETMSMASYVLAGYTKQLKRSSEASLKYVIFGSLSSGIMIYGVSILYGMTGSLNFADINIFLQQGGFNNVPVIVSALMILVGIGYKISVVPFHFWTPDVYEGAPVTITAYLSVASKAAGFAVLIRFIKMAYIDPSASTDSFWTSLAGVQWDVIMAFLAMITMTVGNIVAVWQSNVKRMLAYSAIAHAGYLLMGVTVMTTDGIMAVLIYLVFYLLMNMGAFYVVMLFANKIGSEELDDYVGIGYKAPVLASLLTVFLISLTGLPPTAGFIGKLFIFKAVLDQGWMWLALVGILNSVVSLYFYVKVIRNMWLRGVDNENLPIKYEIAPQIMIYVLAILTIFFGLYFTPVVKWAEHSVILFIGK